MMIDALRPFLRGNQSRLFAGQINSGSLAETEAAGVMGNAVNSEQFADVIKIDVAGSDDSLVEIYFAVNVIAMKSPPVKNSGAAAISRVRRRKRFRFQHGRGHHDLEHGTGRKLRLNRAIQQRRFMIGIERGPLLAGHANREIVGIESGAANHGENFAGVRVHGNQRAFFIREIRFGDGLQIEINRQLNRLAGNGFNVVERAHHFANAVHDDAAQAVRAFELIVVLPLESSLSDDIARAVVAIALIEILGRNFTDVADRIGKHFAMWIAAALDHHEFEDGEIRAMRFYEGDVRFAGSGFDDDGLKLGFGARCFQLLVQIFLADAEALFNLWETFFERLGIVAQEKDAEGWIAIHEHAAFAVEHHTTLGDDGDGAHTVAFRQIRKVP